MGEEYRPGEAGNMGAEKRRPARESRPALIARSVPDSGLLAELDDVLRRRTLLALHDVELDPLTLGQRLEALSLNRGMVHEAVLLAALGRNEAKALGVVEPLDRAGRTHCSYSLWVW